MEIQRDKRFERDIKKYGKNYRTLEDDLSTLQKAIMVSPEGNGSKHWNILKQDGERYIVKVRMMCRAVKGSSFRVIYYYDGEKINLIFLELYFKGTKAIENKKRIEEFWKQQMN